MQPHFLTNLEIQKQQNEPRFNGAYSRDYLPKIKDGACVINLDEYSDIRTHWIALYIQNNDVTHFDSLEQNIFQKRLEHLSVIKKNNIFLEYKHMIQ